MNRLIAGALVREALDGKRIVVLLGGPRESLVFFRTVEAEVRLVAKDTDGFAADVDATNGSESIKFDQAGSIAFALVLRAPVPADVDVVYVDNGSVEPVFQHDASGFETFMRDVQISAPAAELIYSDGDR